MVPVTLYTLATPIRIGRTMPSAMLMSVCRPTAFTGVLNFGCTFVSAAGSAPVRAMPKKMRVEAFMQAMDTAIAELNRAISTRIHRLPQ